MLVGLALHAGIAAANLPTPTEPFADPGAFVHPPPAAAVAAAPKQ